MSRRGTSASPARQVATRVLHRVTEQGAWATPTLDAEIGRGSLEPRDAALASEIVYGTLRSLPSIDAELRRHLRRGKLDAWTRAVLRAGAYELLHLGRVPPRAAVNDAVTLVRSARGARVGGFVNAVLRRVAAARPDEAAPPTRVEVPGWLEVRLREALGEERAGSFLRVRSLPPPIGLRARGERPALIERLRRARPDAEVAESSLTPRGVLVRRAGDPRRLPGYEEGAFAVQEEGAQVVGLAVGARPGERVADACAGRGGKTLQLAEAVGDGGQVTAIDLHERKLELIGAELARLGLPARRVETRPVDLTVGIAGMEGRFDRVLVDAPCSNLGTLHRRPELLLRLGPEDPGRLAELQLSILRQAHRMVRPGGLLLFAVCSPTAEEGPEVAARFGAEHRDLEPVGGALPGSGLEADADGVVRVGPWSDAAGAADAYQIVRWRRSQG